jgi:CBS domain-containing protein
MGSKTRIQRVRIYLSQADQWEGGPRYLAILEQLRRSGATGATALQGLVGFGPGQSMRSAFAEHNDAAQPVVIEWLDQSETVERLLPTLGDLLGDDLVTVEQVPIFQATLRTHGPFGGDRSVGDVMRRPAPNVGAESKLVAALEVMARENLGTLPVVAADGQMVGLLTSRDLAWRAGLRLRPQLLARLTPEERVTLLAPLVARSVSEVMSVEPGSVGLNTSIPQALVSMVEWGYSQIPVVDRAGKLVGLLGQAEVLRELLAQADAPGDPAVHETASPTPVHLVMQASVHQVAADQRLNVALARLLATPERHLLVVDTGGHLAGQLNDITALSGLQGAERTKFLQALQLEHAPAVNSLPGMERDFTALIERDPPQIAPQASLLEAARRLIELEVEQLAVVDDQRRLLGIIARGGLIRALIQQSET